MGNSSNPKILSSSPPIKAFEGRLLRGSNSQCMSVGYKNWIPACAGVTGYLAVPQFPP